MTAIEKIQEIYPKFKKLNVLNAYINIQKVINLDADSAYKLMDQLERISERPIDENAKGGEIKKYLKHNGLNATTESMTSFNALTSEQQIALIQGKPVTPSVAAENETTEPADHEESDKLLSKTDTIKVAGEDPINPISPQDTVIAEDNGLPENPPKAASGRNTSNEIDHEQKNPDEEDNEGEDLDSLDPPAWNGKLTTPPGFGKNLVDPTIWDRAVIMDFGYPFINYSDHNIVNLLKGDEKARATAYNIVKDQLRQVAGLKTGFGPLGGIYDSINKSPIQILKTLKNSTYTPCYINPLVVPAQDLLNAMPDERITVAPIVPESTEPKTGLPVQVTPAFLREFYDILEPTKGFRMYRDYCGYFSPETMNEQLSYTNGVPESYILVRKQRPLAKFAMSDVGMQAGFKGLIHKILRTRTNTVMVRTRVGGHEGAFVMPKPDAESLFTF